jgi:hypothetical protein
LASELDVPARGAFIGGIKRKLGNGQAPLTICSVSAPKREQVLMFAVPGNQIRRANPPPVGGTHLVFTQIRALFEVGRGDEVVKTISFGESFFRV